MRSKYFASAPKRLIQTSLNALLNARLNAISPVANNFEEKTNRNNNFGKKNPDHCNFDAF